MKRIRFLGSSLADLRAFPDAARRMAGFQLDLIQRGLSPTNWRPMPGVGAAVSEIRVRTTDGAFRIFFVACLGNEVVVLHCFQKKTQRTSRNDLELAAKRYKAYLRGEP